MLFLVASFVGAAFLVKNYYLYSPDVVQVSLSQDQATKIKDLNLILGYITRGDTKRVPVLESFLVGTLVAGKYSGLCQYYNNDRAATIAALTTITTFINTSLGTVLSSASSELGVTEVFKDVASLKKKIGLCLKNGLFSNPSVNNIVPNEAKNLGLFVDVAWSQKTVPTVELQSSVGSASFRAETGQMVSSQAPNSIKPATTGVSVKASSSYKVSAKK